MLLLILGSVLVAFILFLVLRVKYPSRYEGGRWNYGTHVFFTFMSWASGITLIILVIVICCLSTKVATESTIDSKIEMYQEENENIEKDIDRIIKNYLEHEHDTYSDLKTEESSITLVTLFPELKSDTLVQQQIEIYVANNAKIKSLKEEKINIVKIKWILYFGK